MGIFIKLFKSPSKCRGEIHRAFQISLLAGLMLLLTGCDGSPSRIAEDISPSLPTGWSIMIVNNVLDLRQASKAYIIGRVSNPPRAPVQTLENYFKKKGPMVSVKVKLTFVPKISSEESNRPKAARAPYEKTFENGARSKAEFDNAHRKLDEIKIPSFYNTQWSIFVEKPDERFIEFYPPEVSAEIKEVMKVLALKFEHYDP
jgi:hypothetical protein